MKSSALISEYLWQPLVTIAPTQRGFLVQPGSTTLPIRLPTGKQWHWPYLTSIRAVDLNPHSYPIRRDLVVSKNVLGDEPIIAATKDMRLVSVEGQLKIRIDSDASNATLATLNKHSVNRLIRPLIRSGVRLAVAEFSLIQLDNVDQLTLRALNSVSEHLAEHGLLVINLQLRPVKPYNPFTPSKDQQSPAGQAQPGTTAE